MYFSLFTGKSHLLKTLKECVVLDARVLANITQNMGRIKLRKTAKSNHQLCHVWPSVRLLVRMEELSSHYTDFDEIRHLRFFSENMSRKFKFN